MKKKPVRRRPVTPGKAKGLISMEDALAAVRAARRDGDVVITTMAAAKVWMDMGTHALDLVFVPSCMSHATSVGLGIALAQPKRRVIVCNGDGSMLMNLGSLVTIAGCAPRNLSVIVLDNGVYEVTGSQPTPRSRAVDFGAVAHASGFTKTARFSNAKLWAAKARATLHAAGPVLVTLDVEAKPERPAPKSPGPAGARALALRAALIAK